MDELLPSFSARSLGVLVREARRAQGYSQCDLAGLLCALSGRPTVTRHEINRYEREARIPRTRMLADLAAALRLPPGLVLLSASFSRSIRALRRACTDVRDDDPPWLLLGYLVGAGEVGVPQPMIVVASRDVPEAAGEVDC